MRPARRRSDAPFLQYVQGHRLGKSQLQGLQARSWALASFEAIGAHALQLIFGDQVWIVPGHQIHLTPAIRLRTHVQKATFAPWRAIGIPLTLQGAISSPHFRMAGVSQRCPDQHALGLGKGTLWLLLGTAGISIAVANAEAAALEGGQVLFSVTRRFRIAPRHQGQQQQQRPHDDAGVADKNQHIWHMTYDPKKMRTLPHLSCFCEFMGSGFAYLGMVDVTIQASWCALSCI